MWYAEFSRIFAFVTSMGLTIGMYAQVIKIFKTKSAHDFTIVLILALLLDEVAWLNYGIVIGEWPVFLLGAFSLPAAIMAFIGYMKYGRGRRKDNESQA